MSTSKVIERPPPDLSPSLDPSAYRAALGSFATGVTVISARAEDGRLVGVTANSFGSLSLDPPLVLWSLSERAYSRPVFEAAEHFVVHVLGADQLDLAQRFAARGGVDKFDALDWVEGVGGAPVIPGAVARFECALENTQRGGDHQVFVGRVLTYAHAARPALAFHGGRFATFSPLDDSSAR